jgi:hypothetical protein
MDDPDLTRLLDLVKAAWRKRPESRDWIDEYLSGEILLTDQAADIAGVSSETIRRRCESAALTNRPLGILIAGSVWLVSLARLLDQIELREGRHGRLIAESRAKKYAEMRSSPQLSPRRVGTATG